VLTLAREPRAESLPAGAGTAAPAWECSDDGVRGTFRRGLRRMARFIVRWGVCHGNRVAYLRRLGARIGAQATLLNRVEEFGTEPWLVEIGSRVTVASGVLLLTHDGASRIFRHRIEGGSPFGNRFGTIRILDNSFIGARSILLPGITIGPDSIVGAGSVVTRDVPPSTVVAGHPARAVADLDGYVETYRRKMVPGLPAGRRDLRRELTVRLWGEER
jgi:carbonic anhydrase/acetyltransferase-like protein (isoleucine patch superfamily)